jgi:hypothetical protein
MGPAAARGQDSVESLLYRLLEPDPRSGIALMQDQANVLAGSCILLALLFEIFSSIQVFRKPKCERTVI